MPLITPSLPKITAPTAAEVCQGYQPSPEAQSLQVPGQTPAQYLQALKQHQLSGESIKFLAHGMPDREATWWATQSAQKVAPPSNPADLAAIQAADAWVKNPTPATQQAAAAAAAKTDYQTPGAWAAQAAAWSQPPAPALPAAPAVPAAPGVAGPKVAIPGQPPVLTPPPTPRLAPLAASGAVMLAAAHAAKPPMPKAPSAPAIALEKPALPAVPPLPKPPEPPKPMTPHERAATAKAHQPFINTGMDIASGKNTWA
jgi:hypothetical protein